MCKSGVRPRTPQSKRAWCSKHSATALARSSGPSWLCHRTCAASMAAGSRPSLPPNPAHAAMSVQGADSMSQNWTFWWD